MPISHVLLVDDEPKILSSLGRELREMGFSEIHTAVSGAEGLEKLKAIPEMAAIVSDYRMPGMDGVVFLAEAQKLVPDATRIMLTGAAGLEMAIEAVNRGQIFRFLVKPCSADILIPAIQAGIRQHQLIVGERELLNKTLNGSIKILTDILSALNPEIFAQSLQLAKLARQLAITLNVEQLWEVELAASLCRIGVVTVPPEVLVKHKKGYPLKEAEQAMLKGLPRLSAQLVQQIPRLENVAQAISLQDHPYHGRGAGSDLPAEGKIPILARILKLTKDYDYFFGRLGSTALAAAELQKHAYDYDPRLLDIFKRKILNLEGPREPVPDRSASITVKIPVDRLELGMMLTQDVMDRHGRLIIARGTVVTDVLKQRLQNFLRSQLILDGVEVDRARFNTPD